MIHRYLAIPFVALVGLTLPAAKTSDTGVISGSVDVVNAKHDGNAVVYVRKAEGDDAKRGAKKHKMWQKEKQFSPQVLVVQKGDEVEFPNGDKLFHNVFSVSRPARFDLGLYKSGESKTVKFKRAGVVDVYCNIHPQMVGKVLVVPTKHYVQTGKDGAYTIPDLPPGDYEVVAWHPHGKDEVVEEVTVEAGKSAKVDFSVTAKEAKDKHTRKDGTPYGRYK